MKPKVGDLVLIKRLVNPNHSVVIRDVQWVDEPGLCLGLSDTDILSVYRFLMTDGRVLSRSLSQLQGYRILSRFSETE